MQDHLPKHQSSPALFHDSSICNCNHLDRLACNSFKSIKLPYQHTWGLNREGVAIVEMPWKSGRDIKNEITELKNEILRTRGVTDATISTTVAGDLLEQDWILQNGYQSYTSFLKVMAGLMKDIFLFTN